MFFSFSLELETPFSLSSRDQSYPVPSSADILEFCTEMFCLRKEKMKLVCIVNYLPK